jgi:streptogramin lyase
MTGCHHSCGTAWAFGLRARATAPRIADRFAFGGGPDGNLWFTESGAAKIGRITTDGIVTEFALADRSSRPVGITPGPDGNVWFAGDSANKVGRITTDGTITEFAIPTASSRPLGITAGPDGNLWFAEFGGNHVGRITPDGTITEFSVPTGNSGPLLITAGPDGNVWFTDLLSGFAQHLDMLLGYVAEAFNHLGTISRHGHDGPLEGGVAKSMVYEDVAGDASRGERHANDHSRS